MKAAGLWLALAAMVLRLALPAGWMPSATVSAPIMMCMPGGAMAMPQDGVPKPAKHHETCPFGAAPHFVTVASLPVLGLPVLWPTEGHHPLQADAATRRSVHAPHSPRGPPPTA